MFQLNLDNIQKNGELKRLNNKLQKQTEQTSVDTQKMKILEQRLQDFDAVQKDNQNLQIIVANLKQQLHDSVETQKQSVGLVAQFSD